jgi:hypothetical protein
MSGLKERRVRNMVSNKTKAGGKLPGLEGIPLPQGADSSSRWLIAAVLAAGKDGCTCDACQLLKKFGGALSTAMLKESNDGGD